MKTIEVKYDELVKHIVEKCPHYFYNFADGESCQRKVTNETCKLHVFADELHCPYDCPRLNTKEYACDKGRCPRVKAIIKNLKAKEVPVLKKTTKKSLSDAVERHRLHHTRFDTKPWQIKSNPVPCMMFETHAD